MKTDLTQTVKKKKKKKTFVTLLPPGGEMITALNRARHLVTSCPHFQQLELNCFHRSLICHENIPNIVWTRKDTVIFIIFIHMLHVKEGPIKYHALDEAKV